MLNSKREIHRMIRFCYPKAQSNTLQDGIVKYTQRELCRFVLSKNNFFVVSVQEEDQILATALVYIEKDKTGEKICNFCLLRSAQEEAVLQKLIDCIKLEMKKYGVGVLRGPCCTFNFLMREGLDEAQRARLEPMLLQLGLEPLRDRLEVTAPVQATPAEGVAEIRYFNGRHYEKSLEDLIQVVEYDGSYVGVSQTAKVFLRNYLRALPLLCKPNGIRIAYDEVGSPLGFIAAIFSETKKARRWWSLFGRENYYRRLAEESTSVQIEALCVKEAHRETVARLLLESVLKDASSHCQTIFFPNLSEATLEALHLKNAAVTDRLRTYQMRLD